jgi:predicted double-glycine peptidase
LSKPAELPARICSAALPDSILKGSRLSRDWDGEPPGARKTSKKGKKIHKCHSKRNPPSRTPAFAVFTALFFCSLLISGCTNFIRPENQRAVPSFQSIPHFIQVPLTRQGKDYTCGVAALQSVLHYYGEEFREDDLIEKLQPTREEGTRYTRMADFARSLNFHVEIFTGMTVADLKKWIDEKRPVIVSIQAWAERPVNYSGDWDDGHYVVAVGYDRENIYFMDPSILGNYGYISIGEFMKRWHDRDNKKILDQFGMIISRGPPAYNPGEIKQIK